MRRVLLIAAGTVLLSTWTTAQDSQQKTAPGPAFDTEIRPLLKTFCFECHGTTKRKGGLDLEKINNEAAAINWPEVWDQVGERLRAREMPPAKSPQPTESQHVKLLDWVAHVARLQVSCDSLSKEQWKNRRPATP